MIASVEATAMIKSLLKRSIVFKCFLIKKGADNGLLPFYYSGFILMQPLASLDRYRI